MHDSTILIPRNRRDARVCPGRHRTIARRCSHPAPQTGNETEEWADGGVGTRPGHGVISTPRFGVGAPARGAGETGGQSALRLPPDPTEELLEPLGALLHVQPAGGVLLDVEQRTEEPGPPHEDVRRASDAESATLSQPSLHAADVVEHRGVEPGFAREEPQHLDVETLALFEDDVAQVEADALTEPRVDVVHRLHESERLHRRVREGFGSETTEQFGRDVPP